MEQYAYKDTTLQIFREVLTEPEFRDWSDVGIAIQAYLRDTENDIPNLAEWAKKRGTPVWVRLVKGAYWDYESVMARQSGWPVPVWAEKWQSDAAYERLTAFLIEHRRWLRPAFASHNIRSLSHAMALAWELPPGSIEIQMLYGMADPIKDVLVGMGSAGSGVYTFRRTIAWHGLSGATVAGKRSKLFVPSSGIRRREWHPAKPLRDPVELGRLCRAT
jgi:RHH-type proline utilization regulon transcriptional repressor/proline dehydrogenase/delta 1-pyrroline-5-carboxylate dehydrogenase